MRPKGIGLFYPALTGSKIPLNILSLNEDGRGSTARSNGTQAKSATSCGKACVTHILWAATNHRWGEKEPPQMEVSLYPPSSVIK